MGHCFSPICEELSSSLPILGGIFFSAFSIPPYSIESSMIDEASHVQQRHTSQGGIPYDCSEEVILTGDFIIWKHVMNDGSLQLAKQFHSKEGHTRGLPASLIVGFFKQSTSLMDLQELAYGGSEDV